MGEEEASLIEAGKEGDEFIPEWQKEILPMVREVLESDDFVPLPEKFETDEYAIMRNCGTNCCIPSAAVAYSGVARTRYTARAFRTTGTAFAMNP